MTPIPHFTGDGNLAFPSGLSIDKPQKKLEKNMKNKKRILTRSFGDISWSRSKTRFVNSLGLDGVWPHV